MDPEEIIENLKHELDVCNRRNFELQSRIRRDNQEWRRQLQELKSTNSLTKNQERRFRKARTRLCATNTHLFDENVFRVCHICCGKKCDFIKCTVCIFETCRQCAGKLSKKICPNCRTILPPFTVYTAVVREPTQFNSIVRISRNSSQTI